MKVHHASVKPLPGNDVKVSKPQAQPRELVSRSTWLEPGTEDTEVSAVRSSFPGSSDHPGPGLVRMTIDVKGDQISMHQLRPSASRFTSEPTKEQARIDTGEQSQTVDGVSLGRITRFLAKTNHDSKDRLPCEPTVCWRIEQGSDSLVV
ncbi:hypothetical protein LIA77_02682 [Sarocladium implicatum]|nr:hypothetical protein LIA77_02682 [Sarocladium implicatum]